MLWLEGVVARVSLEEVQFVRLRGVVIERRQNPVIAFQQGTLQAPRAGSSPRLEIQILSLQAVVQLSVAESCQSDLRFDDLS